MNSAVPGDNRESSVDGNDEDRERRKFLPWWLWILLAAILAVILIIVAILQPWNTPVVTTTPTPTASSSSSPTPSPSAAPTPTATPKDMGQGTFDSSMIGFLSDTLNSQNTAVLAQSPTFSNPVFVLAANSGLNQNMTPDDAVNAMSPMFTPLDPNPWDLALPDSVLDSYRSGPYGDYFPLGAIVAKSHDGHVFSFIGHDKTITTMFMAASEDLLK
ncbi:MAG TPA: hypothetical protein PKI99_06845 [Terrimesophilobacter sp.]|nr:hypothetical protein [Terrimesophilobacter sp.]